MAGSFRHLDHPRKKAHKLTFPMFSVKAAKAASTKNSTARTSCAIRMTNTFLLSGGTCVRSSPFLMWRAQTFEPSAVTVDVMIPNPTTVGCLFFLSFLQEDGEASFSWSRLPKEPSLKCDLKPSFIPRWSFRSLLLLLQACEKGLSWIVRSSV